MGYAAQYFERADPSVPYRGIIPGAPRWTRSVGQVVATALRLDVDQADGGLLLSLNTPDLYKTFLGVSTDWFKVATPVGHQAGGIGTINTRWAGVGLVGSDNGVGNGDEWTLTQPVNGNNSFALLFPAATDWAIGGALSRALAGQPGGYAKLLLGGAASGRWMFWTAAGAWALGPVLADTGQQFGAVLNTLGRFVVNTGHAIYTCDDNGLTPNARFSEVAGGVANFSWTACNYKDNVVVCGSPGNNVVGAALLNSTDLGVTWTKVNNPRALTLNAVVALRSGRFFACGEAKPDTTPYCLISLDDTGATWGESLFPFPMLHARAFAIGRTLFVLGQDPVSGLFMVTRSRDFF